MPYHPPILPTETGEQVVPDYIPPQLRLNPIVQDLMGQGQIVPSPRVNPNLTQTEQDGAPIDFNRLHSDPSEFTPKDPTDQVVPDGASNADAAHSDSESEDMDTDDSDGGSGGDDSDGGDSADVPDDVYDDPAYDTSSSSGGDSADVPDDVYDDPAYDTSSSSAGSGGATDASSSVADATAGNASRSAASLSDRVSHWIEGERAAGRSDAEIEGMLKNMKLDMDNALWDQANTPASAMQEMISDIRTTMQTDVGTAEGLARGYVANQYPYLKDDFGIGEAMEGGAETTIGAGDVLAVGEGLAGEEGALESAEAEEGLGGYEAMGESLAEESEVAGEIFVDLILL